MIRVSGGGLVFEDEVELFLAIPEDLGKNES
jgi:hypothetical protein